MFFGKENKFSLGHDPSSQENQEVVTPKLREEVFPRRNEDQNTDIANKSTNYKRTREIHAQLDKKL